MNSNVNEPIKTLNTRETSIIPAPTLNTTGRIGLQRAQTRHFTHGVIVIPRESYTDLQAKCRAGGRGEYPRVRDKHLNIPRKTSESRDSANLRRY